MDELKEHFFCDNDEVFPRGYSGPLLSTEMRPYYLKSEADKVIANLEESNKMEVEQLLMEVVRLKEKHKKEVDRLLMKIAGLEKLVETADKLLKPKGEFTIEDVKFGGIKLEGTNTHKKETNK